MNRRHFVQQGVLAASVAGGVAEAAERPPAGLFAGVRVRISRPTDRLDELVKFYADALGLPVLLRFNGEGYTGVLLGIPDDRIHLELTHAAHGSPSPVPTKDNLLVLYLEDQAKYEQALERMKSHGHAPVVPANPYWSRGRSETFEDPDGWRVVLYHGKPIGGGY